MSSEVEVSQVFSDMTEDSVKPSEPITEACTLSLLCYMVISANNNRLNSF